jgi:prepilin-type processing-associated H-X9-DG protein
MNSSLPDHGKSRRPAVLDNPNFEYIWKLTRIRNISNREMVMDSVLSGPSDYRTEAFNSIHGGGWDDFGLTDDTNHLSRQTYSADNKCPQMPAIQSGYKPEGANIGFADGHVDWRRFDDMLRRVDGHTDFYW